jgi:PKD repeat protein
VTFTYFISDGLASSRATVAIAVGPVNDAPIAEAGADEAADEGQLVSFSGSYTDSGQLSVNSDQWVVMALAVAWDFGDGATASGTLTPTHTYADDGLYTVTLVVTDDLGGVGSDTLLVTVTNAAPALDPIADQNVVAGETLSLTATYSDPSSLDTHTARVDWGDGLTETLPADAQAIPLQHAYVAPGDYMVTLTVSDDDGGQAVVTFTVHVAPAGYITFLPVIGKH